MASTSSAVSLRTAPGPAPRSTRVTEPGSAALRADPAASPAGNNHLVGHGGEGSGRWPHRPGRNARQPRPGTRAQRPRPPAWRPYLLPQRPLLVHLPLQPSRPLLGGVRLLLQAADLPAHGLERAHRRHARASPCPRRLPPPAAAPEVPPRRRAPGRGCRHRAGSGAGTEDGPAVLGMGWSWPGIGRSGPGRGREWAAPDRG